MIKLTETVGRTQDEAQKKHKKSTLSYSVYCVGFFYLHSVKLFGGQKTNTGLSCSRILCYPTAEWFTQSQAGCCQ